jgi:hypothetical protein
MERPRRRVEPRRGYEPPVAATPAIVGCFQLAGTESFSMRRAWLDRSRAGFPQSDFRMGLAHEGPGRGKGVRV